MTSGAAGQDKTKSAPASAGLRDAARLCGTEAKLAAAGPLGRRDDRHHIGMSASAHLFAKAPLAPATAQGDGQ